MPAPRSPFQTGTSEPTFQGSTQRLSLRDEPLTAEKFIVVVRHGLTTWNENKRIQGDSDEATLTPFGEEQAERVRQALSHKHFDSCFVSPIQRAYKFAQIIWGDRNYPLIPYERLKEANLGWLQGMSNADAARDHPEEFKLWRERPADFWLDKHHNPLNEVFERAKEVWADVLAAEGTSHLLVTHKSIMRAMMCVALGLPTSSFRAVEINNGGVSIFRINTKGEPMLVNLNMTAHMHAKDVIY
ncbi:hypothetical protein WJX73_001570 [Symbiochloris irregularis]|uniref:Phosphoglycerate mutase n=1 Tax=Symbiochloris irregularis TaxID=706552 RepID=A0AAW1NKS9_9CHLO